MSEEVNTVIVEESPTVVPSNDGFWEELILNLIMGGVTVFAVLCLIYMAISSVPWLSYHHHVDTCYSVEGDLNCGKDEGEAVWHENPLPSFIELMNALK